MSTYTGTAITDKAIVRKSPATGMKINALKAGISIEGDRLENGSDTKQWMHISKPMDGWVLASDLNFKKSDAVEPPLIRADAPVIVEPPKDTVTANPSTDSNVKPDPEREAALHLARELASTGRKAKPEELESLAKYNIYMVRKWGDKIMKKYSFEMAAMPISLGESNFQPVPLYDADGNGGGTDKWVRINKDQIARLKSLQIAEAGHPVEKKLQWLSEQKGKKEGRGSAYMWDNDNHQGDLNSSNIQSILWQAIVYGGQPVIVLDTLPSLVMDLPDQKRQKVNNVARILLYDMDFPDERAIQNATATRGRGKDVYLPTPMGMTIRAPIWQGKYQYIPFEWLENGKA